MASQQQCHVNWGVRVAGSTIRADGNGHTCARRKHIRTCRCARDAAIDWLVDAFGLKEPSGTLTVPEGGNFTQLLIKCCQFLLIDFI